MLFLHAPDGAAKRATCDYCGDRKRGVSDAVLAWFLSHPCSWGERFVASRIDVENTRKMYRSHLRMIGETFGDRDPHSITAADVAEWVAEQAETRKPGTVAQRLDCFRLVLDFVGLEPNPARDRRVKLPKDVSEEPNPPSDEHYLAISETLLPRWRLLFVTVEQGGLRIGEAIALRWGDVDVAGGRLRLPRSATKTNQSRWVELPPWLMDAIEDTCPLEDRVPERLVFQGANLSSAQKAMTRACRLAMIPHYSPHDLRHRRITLWHQAGVPARLLADRAGHSKPSESLNTYTHVMPVAEVAQERIAAALV